MIKLFINTKVKNLIKKHSRYKTFREYKDIRKVVLLFDPEDLSVANSFADTLRSDGKQVAAYSFDPKKTVYPQLSDGFTIWDKTKLDFWGIPKKLEVVSYKANKPDTLIDLTKTSSPVLLYLFLNSSAAFRVGFNVGYAQLYDLLIERNQEQDLPFFVNQMLFYMKSLRTK